MIDTFFTFAKVYLFIGTLYSAFMLHGLKQILNSEEEEDIEMSAEIKESIQDVGENMFVITFFVITTFTWLKVLVFTIIDMRNEKQQEEE